MFNVYTNDKHKKENDVVDIERKKFNRREELRKEREAELVSNYRKRMENFLIQMTEKPVHIKDRTNLVVKIRDEFPNKFLGPPSFKFTGTKPTRQRHKEIEEENRVGNENYKTPRIHYRSRDPSKEIQPQMRFTSDGVERIAKSLENMIKNSEDFNPSARAPERLSEQFLLQLSKEPGALKKYIAKTMFPELHLKTHFKGVTSFYLDLPVLNSADSIQDKNDPRRKKNKEDSLDGSVDGSPTTNNYEYKSLNRQNTINRGRDREDYLPPVKIKRSGSNAMSEKSSFHARSQSTQHLRAKWQDPMELSKEVLKNCGFVQKKAENVSVLLKGSGHLTSVPDKTIREVYEELYPSSIDYNNKTLVRKSIN